MSYDDFLTMYNKKHLADTPITIKFKGEKKYEHPCVKCLIRPTCNVKYTECDFLMDYIMVWLLYKVEMKRKERELY